MSDKTRMYEGYIHSNGQLQMKCIDFTGPNVDRSSPYVKKYLGIIESETWNDAEKYFMQKNKEGKNEYYCNDIN